MLGDPMLKFDEIHELTDQKFKYGISSAFGQGAIVPKGWKSADCVNPDIPNHVKMVSPCLPHILHQCSLISHIARYH